MIKKTISFFLCFITVLLLLSGCGETQKQSGKISIVVSTFPQYDWVRNIAGENADNIDLTLLIDNGVDLHSFQPTVSDLAKISECDMFIYVGGISDKWVDDAVKTASNKKMVTVNLLEILGDKVKEEELAEGMEADEDESEEETEYDEHIWLSLKNAKFCCEYIADKLIKLDTKNEEIYSANLKNYSDKLDALDKDYENAVNEANKKTLLFGDRFPFRYLADDYGIEYYAAFSGCSAETEASFKTISFLAEKVDKLNLGAVLTIEGTNHKIAETVVANTKNKNAKILSLNSIQSVTEKDIENGADYLEIMKENLEVLKEALK